MLDIIDADNVFMLYYDPKVNRFRDDMGSIRNDIYRFVRPAQVMLFKENKDNYIARDLTSSFMVMLVYPEECMDLDY